MNEQINFKLHNRIAIKQRSADKVVKILWSALT